MRQTTNDVPTINSSLLHLSYSALLLVADQRLRRAQDEKLDRMRQEPNGHHHRGSARSSMPRRTTLVVLALVQNAMFGGVLYGWASVDRSLLVAAKDRGGAGLSPQQATRAFAVASSASMLATLVLGAVLDAYGPRACSALSHAAIAVGFAAFAFAATWEHCVLGASMMAFGGPGIQVSVVHISNLFPDRQFFVLSGLTGSMSLSFSVFSAFDWLWEKYGKEGMSVRHMFGGYAVLAGLSLVASCLVWPDESFPPPAPPPSATGIDAGAHTPTAEEEYVEAVTAHSHLIMEQPLQSYLRQDEEEAEMGRLIRKPSYLQSSNVLREGGDPQLVSLKDQPFARQLTSSHYLLPVLAFLVTCFLANFYVASFSTGRSLHRNRTESLAECCFSHLRAVSSSMSNERSTTKVADLYDYSSAEQHQLARRLTAIMSCGVLASFVAGYVMDHVGPDSCQVITLLLGLLQLLVLLTRGGSEACLTLCFVLYCLFRQFLFPTFIASITDKLGFKYFGLLNGLAFAASGVSQVFMSALVSAVQGTCHVTTTEDVPSSTSCLPGKWNSLHVVELLVLAVLMLAPRLPSCRGSVARWLVG